MTNHVLSPKSAPRSFFGAAIFVALGALGVGCAASTEFINEGAGQPPDRAAGVVPEGAMGACRKQGSRRPPIVNEALWENLRVCTDKTPRRFLRLGYGLVTDPPDSVAEKRMSAVLEALRVAPTEKDGNVRIVQVLRQVRNEARDVEELRSRVERASSRTFSCDYTTLFGTMDKQYQTLAGANACPAHVYDPLVKGEVCLFDLALPEAQRGALWLTGSWDCFAHTGTPGEGVSCYRMCAYDDHCAAQVSCGVSDFDLLLCALGVCMPEKAEGFY
ncbi:MAG: hypothetical protein IT373_19040 [Polyangiaceae bacterium]|nr:hypothetical protein [Polyangiaceae bacterium]